MSFHMQVFLSAQSFSGPPLHWRKAATPRRGSRRPPPAGRPQRAPAGPSHAHRQRPVLCGGRSPLISRDPAGDGARDLHLPSLFPSRRSSPRLASVTPTLGEQQQRTRTPAAVLVCELSAAPASRPTQGPGVEDRKSASPAVIWAQRDWRVVHSTTCKPPST